MLIFETMNLYQVFIYAALFWNGVCFSQQDAQSYVSLGPASPDTLVNNRNENEVRQVVVGGASAVGFGTSFIFLNKAWYKQYERTPFHFFNDAGEWMQMDKAGHVWTAYTASRQLYGLWRWASVEKKKAVWISSVSSFAYMASIEFLDGRSAAWGWSWGDIAGNTIGASMFAFQQLHWNEQRIQLKFSAHLNKYDRSLQPRADDLFGQTMPALLLKDYNAQTYWLSFNLKSFLPHSKLPAWLNLAAGYGANGMWGGFSNKAYDKNGILIFDRTDIPRRRQWYLSPDVDFTKIKTKSKILRTVFYALNMIKMPLPALELSRGKLQVHALYF